MQGDHTKGYAGSRFTGADFTDSYPSVSICHHCGPKYSEATISLLLTGNVNPFFFVENGDERFQPLA